MIISLVDKSSRQKLTIATTVVNLMPCHKSKAWQIWQLKKQRFLNQITNLEVAILENHKFKAAQFLAMQLIRF